MSAMGDPGRDCAPEEDAATVDVGGRRSLLIASFSGAAGLGMIAAAWALVRWPAAVIASIDRVIHAMGGAPTSLDELARQGRDPAGAAGVNPGDARP